jgi:Fe-S-cluster containining protein
MTTLITPATPFERTVCSCPECVRCCTEQPGSLAAGQLEAIAAHLAVPVRVAALKFWASPGALLLNLATGATYRQGTITPRMVRGRCIFLDQADRCTIHPVAPFGCAMFDTHMQASEAQPRSQWLARSQADPAYQSLRRTLVPATSHKPRGY